MDQVKILKSLAAAGFAALIAAAWTYLGAPGMEPPLPVLGQAPGFLLMSHWKRPFASQELEGKVWIASFVYSSCKESCPMLAAQMKRLHAGMPATGDFRLVSISVDPERDTPARLAAYARDLGAEGGRWAFLTGKKKEIRRLVVEGFKLAAEPGEQVEGDVLHSSKLVLVDKRGRIRAYVDGLLPGSAQELRKAAGRLLKEP